MLLFRYFSSPALTTAHKTSQSAITPPASQSDSEGRCAPPHTSTQDRTTSAGYKAKFLGALDELEKDCSAQVNPTTTTTALSQKCD